MMKWKVIIRPISSIDNISNDINGNNDIDDDQTNQY